MDAWDSIKKWAKYVWKGEGAFAWILNVLFAFILIKFIIYPLIGFAFGTSLPVVAVVSSSMDHREINGELCGFAVENPNFWDTCGQWYEQKGITQQEFEEFPLSGGFWKGDVMLLLGVEVKEIEVGDVIVFTAGREYPIIHRVVDIYDNEGERVFQTKGDHNPESIREFGLTDGRYFYRCYQRIADGVFPSLCGPGSSQVTPSTPGAIPVMDETQISQEHILGRAWGRLPLLGWVKILFIDLLNVLGLGSASQVF